MKAIKLLYFADRYHLRKYGRLITNDTYWAMKKGPVASTSLNIAKSDEDNLADTEKEYSSKFLSTKMDNKSVSSIKALEVKVFSDSDVEALGFAYGNFGKDDKWNLVDLTHEYPEWKKFEQDFKKNSLVARKEMDYLDFFNDPTSFDVMNFGKDRFVVDAEQKEVAKESFMRNIEVAAIFN
jgi:uncharacterized phage-associated protein